ncbi:MAG: hypothetical protein HZB33_03370 [Nitrospirae bacterium]|nr:hypothetical protein [Nitrospirota bacterium]
MVADAIVGFVDILGYKKLLDILLSDVETIRTFEGIVNDIIIKHAPPHETHELISEEDQAYYKEVFSAFNTRIISDTFIFTLPLSKIKHSCSTRNKSDILHTILFAYFYRIASVCVAIIQKTEHILRGGISLGLHYENDFHHQSDVQLLISKAYVSAHQLERKASKAKKATILVDNSLLDYLAKISFPYVDVFFYKDVDGDICFDFYSCLNNNPEAAKILAKVQRGVTFNLEANKNDDEALRNLLFFVDYHNKQVVKSTINCSHLIIDKAKYCH